MDTLLASFAAVTAAAPGAARVIIDMMQRQTAAFDEAVKAAISLGTMSDDTLVKAAEARKTALAALQARSDKIWQEQLALIAGVPDERTSKVHLVSMQTESLLKERIELGIDAVNSATRERGQRVNVLSNGFKIGRAEPWGVNVVGDDLVVAGVGSWPLATIEAVAFDDGLFAFLLEDGKLVELLQDD